jgi:hypothetical protein
VFSEQIDRIKLAKDDIEEDSLGTAKSNSGIKFFGRQKLEI